MTGQMNADPAQLHLKGLTRRLPRSALPSRAAAAPTCGRAGCASAGDAVNGVQRGAPSASFVGVGVASRL